MTNRLRCQDCGKHWEPVLLKGERLLGAKQILNVHTGKKRKVICPMCYGDSIAEYD